MTGALSYRRFSLVWCSGAMNDQSSTPVVPFMAWNEGRVSAVRVLLFSASTSWPRVKFTMAVLVVASGAPVRAMVTLEVSKVVSAVHGAVVHVSMLRFTAVEVELA